MADKPLTAGERRRDWLLVWGGSLALNGFLGGTLAKEYGWQVLLLLILPNLMYLRLARLELLEWKRQAAIAAYDASPDQAGRGQGE